MGLYLPSLSLLQIQAVYLLIVAYGFPAQRALFLHLQGGQDTLVTEDMSAMKREKRRERGRSVKRSVTGRGEY